MVEVSTEMEFMSNIFDHLDIHIHFPAAGTPKDGPSAGVTITSSLVSLLTNRKVRADVSMTGEITLKGLVMPVGGVKEKCLAAHANGIKR
jgi:ATP-dependent Lon protease